MFNVDSLLKTVQKFGMLQNKGYSKSLGQNFLLDLNITQKIVKCSSKLTDQVVIEVGPGPGGLTRAILEQNPKALHVIEMDPKAILAMEELKSYYPNLHIHHKDALSVDVKEFCEDNTKVHILSNLPYHISTALLTKWINEIDSIASLTLMFQKEVADRIIAKPHSKEYGRLSVICQYVFDIEGCFDLSPHLFTPPPKVYSSVVNFIPKRSIDMNLLKKIELVTKHAFSQRRKMIRTTLKPLFSEKDLEEMGLLPTERAENLSIDHYINLSERLMA
jgi:16S rRNA (adenine1518-N6/adenine1519-N6)-dimethyltransferase